MMTRKRKVAIKTSATASKPNRETAEQKRERLRETEMRLQALVGSIDEIVFEFDSEGTFFNVWTTKEDLLVRPRADLIGRGVTDFLSAEYIQPFLEAFRRVLSTGCAESIEYQLDVRVGRRWFLARISPIPSADGSYKTVCMLSRDITERKQAEEDLKTTLSLLNATLDSTADGILVVNAEGKIVIFNQKFVDMWRIAQSIIASRDSNQVLAFVLDQLKDPEGSLNKVKELYTQPDAESYDVLEIKDGRIFECYSKPQRILGKNVGRVLSFRDVTVREWAERIQGAAYRISEAATSGKSTEELFESIHEIVAELMSAKNFYVALYDAATETFIFPYFADEYDKVPVPRRYKKGLTEYVLRTGQPLMAHPEIIKKLIEQGEVELIGTLPVDWLGVPLKIRDKSIGVLAIQSYTQGVQYGEQEKDVLLFVSEQFAMAIERKRAAEVLRDSEKRFRALIEHSIEGIVLLNAQGTILYTGTPVLGYDVGEWINRSAFDLVDPDDLEKVKNDFTNVLQKVGNVVTAEFRARHKDGSRRWIEAISNNLLAEPSVQAVVVNYHDITERKQGEEALRESEEKYRTLFEESKDMVFISTPAGKFVDINPAGVESFGCSSKEELLQIDVARDLYFNPRDRATYQHTLEQQGYVKDFELELKRKNGQKLIVLETATAVRDDKGAIIAYRGIMRDITDRKQAEEALRQSKEKYRKLFEESKDVVFISTPDGKLVDINSAGVELFGYSLKEEMLDLEITRDIYWHPADREMFQRAIRRQGYIKDFELELKRKDGQKLIVSETTTVLRDDRGSIIAYRGIMRDITAQRRLEEQFRQAQKMEGIGTLAGGIAHDFNNILSIIMGHASLLQRKNVDPDRLTQSAQAITKASERGVGVVRQLLTFARKTDVLVESVNFNTVVEDMAKTLKEIFPRTITISIELQRDLPVVAADPNQLHQALLNLCLNARDGMIGTSPAARQGGELLLCTQLMVGISLQRKFSDALADQYVCLSVGDTGVGMDQVTRSRIFEPFFTTKEIGKGTGLGLAVVYGVVKAHHGFIEVESEVGRGTTFHLYFPVPLRIKEIFETKPKDLIQVPGGTETILLVEDEEMLLKFMKFLLEDKGYTVLTAQDGEEAFEIYGAHKDEIALVVSDMGLPKLGGWEAFRKMKEVNPNVKSILASGYIDPNLKSEILKAGAKDVIQKPYDSVEVLQKIREVIDGKSLEKPR